jgi:hypothetical protein
VPSLGQAGAISCLSVLLETQEKHLVRVEVVRIALGLHQRVNILLHVFNIPCSQFIVKEMDLPFGTVKEHVV